MGNIINEITIISAKVERDALNLEWLLNGGDMPLYNGEYTIYITEDGIDFYNAKFTTEEGSTEHSVEFSKYTSGKIYRLELFAGGISGYCTLIVDTFTQVLGTYDGSSFQFQWEINSEGFLPGGFCHMEEKAETNIGQNTEMVQNSAGRNPVNFTVNPHYGCWNTDKIRYSGEFPVIVTFAGSDGEICDGPASGELCFYPKGVRLLAADITSSQTSETLVLTFHQMYGDIPRLCLDFKKAGRLVFRTEAEICRGDKAEGNSSCNTEACGEDVCTVTVDLPHDKVMPQVLRECVVY